MICLLSFVIISFHPPPPISMIMIVMEFLLFLPLPQVFGALKSILRFRNNKLIFPCTPTCFCMYMFSSGVYMYIILEVVCCYSLFMCNLHCNWQFWFRYSTEYLYWNVFSYFGVVISFYYPILIFSVCVHSHKYSFKYLK